ncbi:MAG: hypothetical protein U0325_00165 [Polyangiales bacterium]|jgi:hypothetical protein
MRDTVWSIILTQTPIAAACLWVAWEMRGCHRALRDIARSLARLSGERKGPDGG